MIAEAQHFSSSPVPVSSSPVPGQTPKPRKRTLRTGAQAALLFLVTAAVYSMTVTGLNTFDAVAYANQITLAARTGTVRGLFHPCHLLFNALGFVVWRGAQAWGDRGGPLAVLQHLNGVGGAAGAALFFCTLRRLVPRRIAGPIALLLAGSFGWWICATDGRVNMASDLLLLWSFSLLLRLLRAPSMRLAGLCGAVSGLAVLFHESAGLFVVVGMTATMLASPQERVKRLWAYGAAWAAAAALPYLVVGIVLLHLHSVSGFQHWVSAYAEQGQWWDFHVARNLRRDGFALRHALFVEPPGRAMLGLDAPHSWLGRAWRTVAMLALDGVYLGALTGWLIALVGIALSLPRLCRCRSTHRPVVWLCLLWIGLTGAFFTVWCPGYFVFWIPALVPLLVLLALTLTDGKRLLPPTVPLQQGIRAWVILVILVNFTCSIAPHLRPNQSLWQRVALDARAHTGPRALLIVPGAGVDSQTEVDIPYFAHRACLSVHETLNQSRPDIAAAPAQIQTDITRALWSGRRVYVYGEIWQDPATVRALQAHHPGLTPAELVACFASFRQIPAWNSPRGPVLRLRLDNFRKHGV